MIVRAGVGGGGDRARIVVLAHLIHPIHPPRRDTKEFSNKITVDLKEWKDGEMEQWKVLQEKRHNALSGKERPRERAKGRDGGRWERTNSL